ncbi:MAG: chromosome segregation protein SMC [Deltaproteobacteria bacterium]
MKIKRLEIKGFKSFPDKTVLVFKPGIISIVGPNGCGKSNVFEAIRWVMGEQRVRVLRSKRMDDVIFNGSDSRKPVGMAEVRMVLSNSDRMGPPSMADYDEIMISRRLFRDGQSDYEINNIPCRLSDVTDFFLDTGVGRNSYAIIEQGRVDMVVASKPEDRRVLIEEAAGINRYKARREAAIKKLEKTRQNLLRISDVIGEVRRQNTSLKRQASRAERYRKLHEQLKEMDIQLHAYRCADLQEQHKRLTHELDRNRLLLAQAEAHFSSAQAALEKERLKALNTEKTLKELLEARHRIDVELASIRSRIETSGISVSQLAEFQARSLVEMKTLDEKSEQAHASHARLEGDRSVLLDQVQQARQDLNKTVEEMQAADRVLNEQKKHQDQLRDDMFRALQQIAEEKNLKESLIKRGNEIRHDLDRIEQEATELAASLADERRAMQELEEKAGELKKMRRGQTEHKQRLVTHRHEVLDRIASLREQLAGSETQLAAKGGRLESLQEMQNNYAAYGEGVRFLMKDRDLLGKNALLGPLAEIIDVSPEFQKALTAALGERLGHIVVPSPREGAEAAGRLDEAGAGRTTFIPRCPRSGTDGNADGVPEGLSSLKEMVRLPEGFEGLRDFLLSRCFVVDDIRKAVEIWESNGINVDLVTPKGEMLNRYGEITGGSPETVRGDVFEKKREIAQLQRETALLEKEIGELRSSLKQWEEKLETVNEQIQQADRCMNDINVTEAQITKDREGLEAQLERSERRLAVLGLEKQRLAKESDDLGNRVAEADERLALLETERGAREREKEDALSRIEQLSQAFQQKSSESGEIRVRLAQLEERSVSLEKECKAAGEATEQLATRLAELTEEMERKAVEQHRLTQGIEEAKGREKDLMRQHEAQAEEIELLEGASAQAAVAVKTLEADLAGSENTVRKLTQNDHHVEMESLRVEQALGAVVEKIVERYQVDPRTVPAPPTPPDEIKVTEIRQKLDAMGEVNLAAIAESRETEERLTFLLEQEDDLKKAVDSLYSTINRINKTTRERFQKAFDSINEKFRDIFPFLFRGGEARLELTDEEDLLETGVDIMARPPGKRIRNMDLLSGGEKALTAVALIFSIFLTRPSPFCLLDEVDAPLDESNIVRFNELLGKLAEQTQFLTITHNKRSMEQADTLYGVTMEEPGTSSVVSVEFMD